MENNKRTIISSSISLLDEALKFRKGLDKLTESGLFSVISDFFNSKTIEPKSIDEFASIYGEACDAIIISAKKNETLNYISGILSINFLDEHQFNCNVELYFQNTAKKWIVKKASSGNLPISERLNADAIHELTSQKTIKIEVTAP